MSLMGPDIPEESAQDAQVLDLAVREHTESKLIQSIAIGLLVLVFLFILAVACFYGGKRASENAKNDDLKTVSVDVAGQQEVEKADPLVNEFLGLVIDAAHKQENLPESFSVKVHCEPVKFVSEITPVEEQNEEVGVCESPKSSRRHRFKCFCF